MDFMSKHKTPPKASATAEGARTVEGRQLPENPQVVEAGTPDAGENSLAITEAVMSLAFPEAMTEADYFAYGRKMGDALQGASWKVGDYANFGKAKFGIKDYTRLADETGLDEVYIRQCASIAERVPAEHRSLASLERFRLLLPKREKTVKDGKTAVVEEIPALVGRHLDWTARELRTGKKDTPKELTAADTGSAAGSPTVDAANAEAGSKSQVESDPADAALKAATAEKPKGEMTATAIYETARTLQIGIELLSKERLAVVAIMEQKFAVIKPLAALCRILSDQIRTELQKDS
jgi:hypothetical protein